MFLLKKEISSVSHISAGKNTIVFQREDQKVESYPVKYEFYDVMKGCFSHKDGKLITSLNKGGVRMSKQQEEVLLELKDCFLIKETILQREAIFKYETKLSKDGIHTWKTGHVYFKNAKDLKITPIEVLDDHFVRDLYDEIILSTSRKTENIRETAAFSAYSLKEAKTIWTRPLSSFKLDLPEVPSGRVRYLGIYKDQIYVIIAETIVQIDLYTGETVRFWRDLGEDTFEQARGWVVDKIPMINTAYFDEASGKIRGFTYRRVTYWEINLSTGKLSISDQEENFKRHKCNVYGPCRNYRGKYAYFKSIYRDDYPAIVKFDTETFEFVDIYRFEDLHMTPQAMVMSDDFIGVLGGRSPTLLYTLYIFEYN